MWYMRLYKYVSYIPMYIYIYIYIYIYLRIEIHCQAIFHAKIPVNHLMQYVRIFLKLTRPSFYFFLIAVLEYHKGVIYR